MANFAGLTFTVQPVVTGAGALNTAGIIAGTSLVAGILDPTSTQRIFNPQAEGNPVVSADNATKWLPLVKSLTATQKTDNLQSGTPTETGQVQLFLTPAAANTVEASSVLNFYLSPAALVVLATGTF
jgi:hypothetical protein